MQSSLLRAEGFGNVYSGQYFELVDQGMSAEEIERVVKATSSADSEEDE